MGGKEGDSRHCDQGESFVRDRQSLVEPPVREEEEEEEEEEEVVGRICRWMESLLAGVFRSRSQDLVCRPIYGRVSLHTDKIRLARTESGLRSASR